MIRVPDSGKTQRQTVWAMVAMVLGVLVAVVVLEATDSPDEDHSTTVLNVLGILAPTLAVLVAMRQVGQVNTKVEQVAQDTHDLTNGLLSASVRKGVADVIHDDLIDPAALPQLAVDQAEAADRQDDTP